MKPLHWSALLLILPLLHACAVMPETSLLPGMTYCEGPEALTGKLTFLLSRNVTLETNSPTSASVYEFDLSDKKLRKVADAPQGLFIASAKCGAFCVVFRPGNWYRGDDTNVFIYVDAMQRGQTLTLDSPPKQTFILEGHVFFVVEHANGTSLLDYDIARDQTRQVLLPDASKWQYQHFDQIHAPRERTNTLHFYYKGYGNRLADGKEYRHGFYSLNVLSGDIHWFAELLDDQDDESYTYRASDGRYVYFEGADAPFRGFKLVSSPWDFRQTRQQDPNGDRVKVLKVFSRLSAIGGNAYILSQISPDGRHALVRLQEPSVPKSPTQPGWMNTYFLIDVSNGANRVLLKEEVEHGTSGSMSVVRWVR
jgi:hypothetical protein